MVTVTKEDFINQITSWDEDWNLYDFKLKKQWITGGVSGGNCWSDGGHYSIESEEEPADGTVLKEIIEHFAPDLSALAYIGLLETPDLYEISHKTNYEYYGNYEEYKVKTLNLDVLYDYLKDNV